MSDREFLKYFAGIIGALAALTVVLIITANIIGAKPKTQKAAVNGEQIAERIKPVGEVTLASSNPVVNALIPAAHAAADGKTVYEKSCKLCHDAGLAGAPKTGDKAAWAPRIKQGMDVMYTNAIKGTPKGMPPKGTYSGPDADVKAAVDYMVNASK
jgi:cytochrome c5